MLFANSLPFRNPEAPSGLERAWHLRHTGGDRTVNARLIRSCLVAARTAS